MVLILYFTNDRTQDYTEKTKIHSDTLAGIDDLIMDINTNVM